MDVQLRAFDGPRDWEWVTSRTPLRRVEDTNGIVAECEGEQLAAVMFDNWTHNSVHIHQVIDNPFVLRHGLFEAAAEYVFDTCGRKLCIGVVPSDNLRALKLNKKIGFVEAFRIADAVKDGVDLVVMLITPEQCRFYHPPRLAAVGGGHGRS